MSRPIAGKRMRKATEEEVTVAVCYKPKSRQRSSAQGLKAKTHKVLDIDQ